MPSLTVWGSIGGCHHYHPTLEKGRKESLQNHGIRYVGHLELIETEQVRLLCHVSGDRTDGIVDLSLTPSLGRHTIFKPVDTCSENVGKESL